MIFTDAPELDPNLRADDLPGTFGGGVNASMQQSLYNSPTWQISRTLEDLNAGGPTIDYETARTKARAAGVDIQIDPKGVSQGALDLMIERKRFQARTRDALARAPGGVAAGAGYFLSGLGAGLLDPINAASAFIPVARFTGMANVAREAGMLGEAGAAATSAARFSARARVGAVEGGVGQAILEPLTAYRANQEQEDYGITDTLLNIGFGTVLGAVAHTGLGALGDRAVAAERGRAAKSLIDDAKTAPDRAVNYDVPAVWRKDSAAAKLQAASMEEVAVVTKAEVVAAVEGRKFDSSVLVGEPKFRGMTENEYIAAINQGAAAREFNDPMPQEAFSSLPSTGESAGAFKAKDGSKVELVKGSGDYQGTVFAVVDGKTVGYMAPEAGTTGLFVADEFRGKGIGEALSSAYRTENPMAPSGGFSAAGEAIARKVFKKLAASEQAAVDPAKVQSAAAASHLPENDVHYDAKAKAEVDEAVKMQGEAVDPAEAVTRATQEAQAELATLSQQLGIDPEKNAAMRSADELAATASRYSKAIEAYASCQVRS